MAAKRYHQSKRDRMHESRGEERHMMEERHARGKVRMHGHLGEEHYAGADPRRRQEMEDGRMIREDRNAVANLPQHVIQHDWERPYNRYAKYELDDTMHGIDRQEDEDGSEMMKHLQPGKY